MKHSLAGIIASVLILSSAARASNGDGGYAAPFFQIPMGARPTGLGGAYLGVSDDGAGPLFNPAGLADLSRPVLGTAYRSLSLDRVMGYVTVTFPARGQAAVGLNWLYAGSGEVMARDQNGVELGHTLGMASHAFSALFAKKFEDYLSAGLKASYLQASFAEMTAFSVSFDFGVMLYLNSFFGRETQYTMPVQDMRLGLTVMHVAAEYRWHNENYLHEFRDANALGTQQNDAVPAEVGVGGSARFINKKLLAAADLRKNDKQDIVFHGGAEYLLVKQLSLRSGYSDKRFAAGAGFTFAFGKRILAIDYAFSSGKVAEGSDHIFSLDLQF
ncbi:MAG TPA: PorV/PorQ family protein [Candidatus Deferrimicrobium sp.]|nr:PorV/PorQ family protein [Candidatus Deferrimicrobium sp.]